MQISGVNNPLEAAKWGKTPLIQKKAADASKNAMTDAFVEKLQEQARKDAQKGDYMSEEAIQMRHSQMGAFVSPDRSAPIAQMSQALQKVEKEHEKDPLLDFLDRLFGYGSSKVKGSPDRITATVTGLAGGCSGDIDSTPENQVATIYSPDGEMIASYNTSGGGWQNHNTQAENRFLLDSNTVYKQAYDAARAEIDAGAQKPAQDRERTSLLDIRI